MILTTKGRGWILHLEDHQAAAPASEGGAVRYRNGGAIPAKLAPLTSFRLLVPDDPTLSRPSDFVQGVALSTTALMPFRFFAQTALFSVSPSSFSLSHADIVRNIITVIRAGCRTRRKTRLRSIDGHPGAG